MNILRVNLQTTNLSLTPLQKSQCPTDGCLAYIRPTDIGVTTCGTRIACDNVFPQRIPASMVDQNNGWVDVHAMIDNQQVLAVAPKQLLEDIKLFDFCAKKTTENGKTYYSECKHVKLLLSNQSITIGK